MHWYEGSALRETSEEHNNNTGYTHRFFFSASSRGKLSLLVFPAFVCSWLLLWAVAGLRGLYFNQSFPDTRLENWVLKPTRMLFPGKDVVPQLYRRGIPVAPASTAWKETALLLGVLLLVFGIYLLALHFLSSRVTLRYILLSTAVLGALCLFFPIVTSQDLFSYIAYARLGIIHHLNPLTAVPRDAPKDPVYAYIYWTTQPSAYGPVWIIITSALQWLVGKFNSHSLLLMILLLRMLGLAAYLACVYLIWSLSSLLLPTNEASVLRQRRLATLAFAWNPLLLLESTINAHNDIIILCLILLMFWFLQPRMLEKRSSCLIAAALLTLAVCIKVTMAVLIPGLILFLWCQPDHRLRHVATVAITCISLTIILYAPFWQHGQVLHVFKVNPGVSRDINSPYEFAVRFYESLRGRPLTVVNTPGGVPTGAPIEAHTHIAGLCVFLGIYGILCLYALIHPSRTRTLDALVRWMLLAWFLYCLVGSPWLWPWYFITFFGLFAIVEATGNFGNLAMVLRLPLAVRLFSLGLLCLYVFATWGPHSTLIPYFPYLRWIYLRGLVLCLIPLVAINFMAIGPFLVSLGALFKEEYLYAERLVRRSIISLITRKGSQSL